MAHTFHNLLYHVIFGVKHRQMILSKPARETLFPYMAGIVQQHDGHPIVINGVHDRVHVFVALRDPVMPLQPT